MPKFICPACKAVLKQDGLPWASPWAWRTIWVLVFALLLMLVVLFLRPASSSASFGKSDLAIHYGPCWILPQGLAPDIGLEYEAKSAVVSGGSVTFEFAKDGRKMTLTGNFTVSEPSQQQREEREKREKAFQDFQKKNQFPK